jgi:hypothetical protein
VNSKDNKAVGTRMETAKEEDKNNRGADMPVCCKRVFLSNSALTPPPQFKSVPGKTKDVQFHILRSLPDKDPVIVFMDREW